ncbi:uncharacterized protein IL334_001368 [Kwoniella shivajii]|uniref:Brl1/Brr6 domain-containing protein n=1 Tax=Kwoniella shivajii TaxID=564305 RepID=A0ABZ1CRR3_9TREE|nr:hypothetical protein IL334_001368 [Kwoniella shivajii]
MSSSQPLEPSQSRRPVGVLTEQVPSSNDWNLRLNDIETNHSTRLRAAVGRKSNQGLGALSLLLVASAGVNCWLAAKTRSQMSDQHAISEDLARCSHDNTTGWEQLEETTGRLSDAISSLQEAQGMIASANSTNTTCPSSSVAVPPTSTGEAEGDLYVV